MNEHEFRSAARYADAMRRNGGETAEYWAGFCRGLRRSYHGEAFGTADEHATWMALGERADTISQQRGRGYRAGLGYRPLTMEALEQVGRALYGDRWQSALAHALGVDSRRVRAWARGERSVPPGVWVELVEMLEAKGAEVGAAKATLRAQAQIKNPEASPKR